VGRNTELLHTSKEMDLPVGKELFEALDREGVYRGECRMRRKDGSIFSYRVFSVREIRDDAGKRHAVVSVVRDISKRKRMEEKNPGLHEARWKEATWNFRVLLLSHPTTSRNRCAKSKPLGTCSKQSMRLLLDEDGRDYIRRMINAAGRMQALIKGLLSYSRISTTGLPLCR
jgi:hypothetical protein